MRWGVLGAAWIADIAVFRALREAEGSELVAIAARDPERARAMAARHGVARVLGDYAEVLADPGVDAVYVPLPNSLHLPWVLRALAAGKHVLCEKPLAMDAAEAAEMAEAAETAGVLLMEAAMYRFHPRMQALVAGLRGSAVRHVSAAFTFMIERPGNYRLEPHFGGGALLDIGFYTADVARWVLGEPERVEAVMRRDRVDMTCSALLGFPSGGHAALFASFECPEHQELTVLTSDRVVRVEKPFTSYRDPYDPYQLMVEAFARTVRRGGTSPRPVAESVATMRLLDRIRDAAA